jgi:hypothetical protein
VSQADEAHDAEQLVKGRAPNHLLPGSNQHPGHEYAACEPLERFQTSVDDAAPHRQLTRGTGTGTVSTSHNASLRHSPLKRRGHSMTYHDYTETPSYLPPYSVKGGPQPEPFGPPATPFPPASQFRNPTSGADTVGRKTVGLRIAVWTLAALLVISAVIIIVTRLQLGNEIAILNSAAANEHQQIVNLQNSNAAAVKCSKAVQDFLGWWDTTNPEPETLAPIVSDMRLTCSPGDGA